MEPASQGMEHLELQEGGREGSAGRQGEMREAEPSPAPSDLCRSTLLSFYFYFIFKMKQGKEIQK